ncbi:hypothetical protein V5O48_015566 [Marasmius crinis-equi]|uniref:Uncharacterized protein n=1 Tax=Marasmius crinis-equi TaxID=585013 RepID=A0ABR3EU74_9AGAR
MVLGILAPEYTTVWALRQWLAARYVTKQMAARDDVLQWSMTHSFFLIMGGFVLADEQGKPISSLRFQEMIHLKEEGRIQFPSITEKEIQDKSKGDALSKVLILVQTTWFLLQVLARAVLRLPMTELEVVTIGFASLNIVAFIFWYKKPLNVDCAVQIPLLCRVRAHSPYLLSGAFRRPSSDTISLPDLDTVDITDAAHHDLVQENRTVVIVTGDHDSTQEIVSYPLTSSNLDKKANKLPRNPSIIPFTRRSFFTGAPSYVLDTIIELIHTISGRIMPEILDPGHTQNGHPSHEDETYYDTTRVVDTVYVAEFRDDGSLRVPTFHGGLPQNRGATLLGTIQMVVAIFFGGVHCIAWKFGFPSPTEKWLWRVSALLLIAVPLHFLLLLIVRRNILKRRTREGSVRPFSLVLGLAGAVILRYPRVFVIINRLALYLYLIVRMVVVVLPFVLLRDLPAGAFVEVEWTTFIPHF